MRKPVLGVADQVRHKPGCTATKDGQRLEILDLGSGVIDILGKTKALISCTVTPLLICASSHNMQKPGFLMTRLVCTY